MSAFTATVLAAAIADNIVLGRMLGLCPFIGLSKRIDIATGVGIATTAVLTTACMLAWCIDRLLPPSLGPLRPLIFIALVACTVQATEMLIRLTLPRLHRALGVFLPLIATNCAVLGVILLALHPPSTSFWQTTATGLGGGIGFLLAITSLSLLRRRTIESRVPIPFRGAPLAIINAGLMALAFSALTHLR